MRVSIETAHGLTRKMTIAVPSATFEGQFAEHVKKAAGQVKLPGFRPGKVPISEVRRRFGPRLRQEVASDLLQTSLQEAVQEQDLALASRADIEITKLEAGADFEFTATFEVLPEFEVADLQQLRIRQPVAQVSDADVDAMVQTLREQRVNWQAVDREAGEGDRLTIDYSLTVEGEVVTEGEGKSLIVGSSGLLPELDQTVRGMTAGDARVFPATLPGGEREGLAPRMEEPSAGEREGLAPRMEEPSAGEREGLAPRMEKPSAASDDDPDDSQDGLDQNEGDDDAAAATAEAESEPVSETDDTPPPEDSASAPSTSRQAIGKVTVHAVEESSLPDLDDEFFDQFGISDEEEGEGREERFRADVRDRMTVELGNALREAQRREALAVLGRSHRFDLPQAMVEAEVAQEKSRLAQMLNDVPDELPPVFVAMAEQRVRVQLAVNKIVTSERMAADDQRVRDRIEEISSAYEESARVRNAIFAHEEQLATIEASVLEEQVVEHIMARAQVEEVSTSYADVMNGRALPEEPDPPLPDTEDADPQETQGLDDYHDDADEEAIGDDAPGPDDDAQAGIGGRFRRMFGKRK